MAGYDTNADGIADTELVDNDGDGVADVVGYDLDQNGLDDAVETAGAPSGAVVAIGVGASGEVIMSGPGVVGPATNLDPQINLQIVATQQTSTPVFGTGDSDRDGYVDNHDADVDDPRFH